MRSSVRPSGGDDGSLKGRDNGSSQDCDRPTDGPTVLADIQSVSQSMEGILLSTSLLKISCLRIAELTTSSWYERCRRSLNCIQSTLINHRPLSFIQHTNNNAMWVRSRCTSRHALLSLG